MSTEPPIPQSQIDALLAGHALGDLDSDEREQLAALLQQNPSLQQRLDEFRTTLELLPLALPATAPPPPRLRQRLLAGTTAPNRERPTVRDRQAGGWLVPTLLGAALLVLGLQLHQTRQQVAQLQEQLLPAATTLQAVNRRLPLRAMDPTNRAGGEVLVTGNPAHNMLVIDSLPPLSTHQTYRLWAKVNGRDVGCVAFVPDRHGHVGMPIPTSPTTQASSVSVSVETDPYGTTPSGPTVLATQI